MNIKIIELLLRTKETWALRHTNNFDSGGYGQVLFIQKFVASFSLQLSVVKTKDLKQLVESLAAVVSAAEGKQNWPQQLNISDFSRKNLQI